MSTHDFHQNEDEEEYFEVDEANYKDARDAVIVAIDVSASMLKSPPVDPSVKNPDLDTPIAASLKCVSHFMEQRIISNPRDMLGVLFFGTKESHFPADTDGSSAEYPGCYVYIDLDIPAATDVRSLKKLIEGDTENILVPGERPSMANVLFCANQIFTTRAPNFLNRRLFILTDDDEPSKGDKQSKTAAAVRAKDLYDLGVIIELFPIEPRTEEGPIPFNTARFYDDIVYRDASIDEAGNLDSTERPSGLSLFKSLISDITSRKVPKRALFAGMPFEIAPGLKISVNGYNIISPQKPVRSAYVWLDGDKPQLVKSEAITLAEDNAEAVKKEDIKKAYKFGGEFVYFTQKELDTLRYFEDPVIRILGFKPSSCILPWQCVKRSTFIFPSEAVYKGSTRVFTALWRKLVASDKVAICWVIPRRNATPTICALFATRVKKNPKTNTPYLPEGMWLQPIPFADDLREGPADYQKVKPSSKLVEEMCQLVENLQLAGREYDPTRYANPALQWHYRILQSMALEEEVPTNPVDETQPRFAGIRSDGFE